MNFNFIDVQSIKWELASRLSSYAKDPEIVLKSVFNEALAEIESYQNIKMEKSLKEKISEKFSKRKVIQFQEAFIRVFSEKVLHGFSVKDMNDMLQEHIKTGSISNEKYNNQLLINFDCCRKSLISHLENTSRQIATRALPEIVNALEEEGIKLIG